MKGTSQTFLYSCIILTTLVYSVRLMCHHGQSHVRRRERQQEMQEVHQRQVGLLLEWSHVDEQGEGPSEDICTEATCPGS